MHLETIKSPALPLESINNIHGSDGLPPGVLGVCDRVPDHVLKEVPEDAPDLLIDVTADTLDTTSPSETADSWLCDTLDVLAHNLAMPLGTTLTETLTTFASSRHDSCEVANRTTVLLSKNGAIPKNGGGVTLKI